MKRCLDMVSIISGCSNVACGIASRSLSPAVLSTMACSPWEVAGGAGFDMIVLRRFSGYTQSIPDETQLAQGISRLHFFFRFLHDAQALTSQLQHNKG
jgi:hypothetical protein